MIGLYVKRSFLIAFLLQFFLHPANPVPFESLGGRTLASGEVISFELAEALKGKPFMLFFSQGAGDKTYAYQVTGTSKTMSKWSVPRSLPPGRYHLHSDFASNSYEIKITSLIHLHLYGYQPPGKANTANPSIPRARTQIENAFNVFSTTGKVDEFHIDTLFGPVMTVANINKSLINANSQALHLFYFYLYLEEGKGGRGAKDLQVLLADEKLTLPAMFEELAWGHLLKVVWIHSQSPIQVGQVNPTLSNTFFIQEPPSEWVVGLSNVLKTGGGLLDRKRGKHFLTLMDIMKEFRHLPRIKKNSDILNLPIIGYEWVPEETVTQVIESPKYKYITNVTDQGYISRNFLVFERKEGKRVIKVRDGSKLKYWTNKKPGYWK